MIVVPTDFIIRPPVLSARRAARGDEVFTYSASKMMADDRWRQIHQQDCGKNATHADQKTGRILD